MPAKAATLDIEAPKTETKPLRSAEPATFDLSSPTYRRETELAYDEAFPDRKHSWQSRIATPRYLEGKRQTAVLDESGEPIADGGGDILVAQDREAFDRRGFQEHDMSLDTVAQVTEERDPIDGKPVMVLGQDMVQTAKAKTPLKPAQQKLIEIRKQREERREKHAPAAEATG